MEFYLKHKYTLSLLLGAVILGILAQLPWLPVLILIIGGVLDLYFFHSSSVTNYSNAEQRKRMVDIERKHAYLLSHEWHLERRAALASANYSCECCGGRKPLEVHHITYRNLYKELPEDLATLCRDCHQTIHTNLGYSHKDYFPVDWQEQQRVIIAMDAMQI